MKTIYDWSKVPKQIKWLAIDESGGLYGYKTKPFIKDSFAWQNKRHDWLHIKELGILQNKTICWRNSLEKRPKNQNI